MSQQDLDKADAKFFKGLCIILFIMLVLTGLLGAYTEQKYKEAEGAACAYELMYRICIDMKKESAYGNAW